MKLNIYSIYDSASGLYSRPFYTQADAEAMRSFTDIATDADHPIGKHPEDYSLHRVGMWNDNIGQLTDEENECLVTALETISNSRNIRKPVELDLVEKIRKTGEGNGEPPLSNQEILEVLGDAVVDTAIAPGANLTS